MSYFNKMKNALLIILIIALNGIYAQTSSCNFTMNLQGNIVKDSTYSLQSFSFTGVKTKHHKKIMDLIDYDNKQSVTLNIAFFEDFLAAICQYKKYHISSVMVGGSGESVQLLIVYKE